MGGKQEGGDGGAQSRKHGRPVAVKYSPEVGLCILLSWYSACLMKAFTSNPRTEEVEAGVSQIQGHPSLCSEFKAA